MIRSPLKPLTAMIACALLAACASGSRSPPPEVVRLQNDLARVTGDTRIPPHAGPEIEEARRAVDALVVDGRRMDEDTFDHNVYIADRLIQVAEAEGLAGYAEASSKELAREREGLLLEARTREADLASARASAERAAADAARADAAYSRADADTARMQAEAAQRELAATQARLSELEAKQTERGLVVTLGDVLFEVDRAELKPGAERSLSELVQVLRENDNSTVVIEGHTDSTGGRDYNLSLSKRRAESVRNYLIGQGVAATRISAAGLGPDYPVASNSDAAGRQQNRRVELVIQDRPAP
jgi:outer membrane protein OmpA-like peptidoglycan-associated protein